MTETQIADPLAVVVQWLAADAGLTALVGTRIATAHKYDQESGGWKVDQPSIVVRMDGGSADLYLPNSDLRIELDIYSEDIGEAMGIVRVLNQKVRDFDGKGVVRIPQGDALLHKFIPESLPSQRHDPDVDMLFLMIFYRAVVSETIVAEI